ncbi:hypothetical protein GIB67_040113 [Kingdonia uniflora]|uniref:Pentatricopeptide repeat-containing protein n=1 Tax=Kingdonia uniflora TaxID=39325 RepID=A0A7J7MUJ9_9MAGN|nr:hypothetical protein GIB67_040113 [Kingdonia uniflora]
MVQNATSHDHFTYTYALKACCLLKAVEKGHKIHAHCLKSGYTSDIFILNSLIHLYYESNDILSARRVFDMINVPNVVSWTSILSGLVKCGCEEEAVMVFGSMDVRPTTVTLVSVLSACSRLRALKYGKSVHGYYLRNFSYDNNIVDNAVLNLYGACGCCVSLRNVFDRMPNRDVVSWTTMVGGYVMGGCYEEAIEIFGMMVQGGEVDPNEATLVNVLSACSSLGVLSLGRWVHSFIDKRGDLLVDSHVGNSLVNMYAKCGDVGMALKVFNELKCKDLVSWSIIIRGMAMNGYAKQVMQLFSLMLCHGIAPDGVLFVGLLSACSHVGLVDKGLMYFKAMKDVYRISPEMEHYACMVDIYGRTGLFDKVETFIKGIPMVPDGVIWGALANACKLHGDEKVLERISRSLLKTTGAGAGTYALISNILIGEKGGILLEAESGDFLGKHGGLVPYSWSAPRSMLSHRTLDLTMSSAEEEYYGIDDEEEFESDEGE